MASTSTKVWLQVVLQMTKEVKIRLHTVRTKELAATLPIQILLFNFLDSGFCEAQETRCLVFWYSEKIDMCCVLREFNIKQKGIIFNK